MEIEHNIDEQEQLCKLLEATMKMKSVMLLLGCNDYCIHLKTYDFDYMQRILQQYNNCHTSKFYKDCTQSDNYFTLAGVKFFRGEHEHD